MELREWLIILGLTLVTIIVIDGVRRLQRQRRVPRLDQVDASSTDAASGSDTDPEQEARDAEVRSELPNGGARVVRPAAYGEPRAKPKLERQDHPGPSRVLASWRQESERDGERPTAETPPRPQARAEPAPRAAEVASAPDAAVTPSEASHRHDLPEAPPADTRQAPPEGRPATARPAQAEAPEEPRDQVLSGLAADPEDHEGHHDDERYRLVDFDGVSDSLRERSARVGDSMQRFGSSLQQKMASHKEQRKKDKLERERQKAERQAREASRRQQEQAEREAEARRAAQAAEQDDGDDPLFASTRSPSRGEPAREAPPPLEASQDEAADERLDAWQAADEAPAGHAAAPHPTLQRALRNGVKVEHTRETLSNAEELIVISVMSRDEEGFAGSALLDLMLACGLRYCRDMQIFHRFETEDPHSALQFSMVNIVKPGTFPLAAGDDFVTPGVSLLMPLPGAQDSSAAFEAMVETAMVVVRHLGGELKDENQSVMTAQTVGFARERVQEFDRRHRLHRTQVN